MPQLPLQLLLSTAMVVVTVGIHGLGLALLAQAVSGERRIEEVRHLPPMSPRGALFTLITVLSLFFLHGIEIWSYASLYTLLQAFENFEEALYFSTISYAAIGYSDAAIDPQWRLLGAIEGINGVILLGWSTAFFVNLLTRLRR